MTTHITRKALWSRIASQPNYNCRRRDSHLRPQHSATFRDWFHPTRPPTLPLRNRRTLRERAARAPTAAAVAEEEAEEAEEGPRPGAAAGGDVAPLWWSASRSSSNEFRWSRPNPKSPGRRRRRRHRRALEAQKPLPPMQYLVFEPLPPPPMAVDEGRPADCIRPAAAAAYRCPSRPRPRSRVPAVPMRGGGTWPSLVSIFVHDLRVVFHEEGRKVSEIRWGTSHCNSLRRLPSTIACLPAWFLPSRLVAVVLSEQCCLDGWRPSFFEGARSPLAPRLFHRPPARARPATSRKRKFRCCFARHPRQPRPPASAAPPPLLSAAVDPTYQATFPASCNSCPRLDSPPSFRLAEFAGSLGESKIIHWHLLPPPLFNLSR